ncbi:MAG: tetratricopeptide repeat protein, partial [Prevotella sp.]|nr:tetratricopeptide repeat protein [Prevotella sp.]
EVKGRLYQQALRDIARAILLDPKEPLYYAEMASLQLRVNMADKALQTAERCVAIAPEYSEGYLLLGLAQIHTNDKEKGLANLRKAQEMGNEQAQALIDKYGK